MRGSYRPGILNGVFTAKEIAEWWTAFERDSREGNLFVAFPGFIVSGAKEI